MRNLFICKQVILELVVECRGLASDPLQYHGRVFLFLIAVVGENGFQLFILAGIYPLIILIDRFQLFHE
jgi:hypothetical protein